MFRRRQAPPPPPPPEGMSGDAKTGIAIFVILFVGLIGFLVYWFVIREETPNIEKESSIISDDDSDGSQGTTSEGIGGENGGEDGEEEDDGEEDDGEEDDGEEDDGEEDGVDVISQPTYPDRDWQCIQGYPAAYRRTIDGDIECLTLDGQICDTRPCDSENLDDVIDEGTFYSEIKPLTCGQDHFDLFNMTGYEEEHPNHWCSQGKTYLESITNPTDWHCRNDGDPVIRKDAAGDVECLSLTGQGCIQGSSCSENLAKIKGSYFPEGPIDPLACGVDHEAVWGIPGYGENSTHWCQLVRDHFAEVYDEEAS